MNEEEEPKRRVDGKAFQPNHKVVSREAEDLTEVDLYCYLFLSPPSSD